MVFIFTKILAIIAHKILVFNPFSVKKAEIIASMKDDMYKHLRQAQFDTVIDATTLTKDAAVYFAVVEKEGKRLLVKFEPPLKCLEYLKVYAPSKVKIYKIKNIISM